MGRDSLIQWLEQYRRSCPMCMAPIQNPSNQLFTFWTSSDDAPADPAVAGVVRGDASAAGAAGTGADSAATAAAHDAMVMVRDGRVHPALNPVRVEPTAPVSPGRVVSRPHREGGGMR